MVRNLKPDDSLLTEDSSYTEINEIFYGDRVYRLVLENGGNIVTNGRLQVTI